MRQNFNEGQEIVSQDLNSISSRIERGILDRIIYEMIKRNTNGFFQNSFKVNYTNSGEVLVKKGLGFQTEDTGDKDPVQKPLVLDSDLAINLNAPDAGNNRIDIIVVKNARSNIDLENRNFKDDMTQVISLESMVVSTDWQADIKYIAGTPSGSPVEPATPSGYMKIATMTITAITGLASQSAITDNRYLLPFCISNNDTGTSDYNAIVGLSGTDQGVTHSTLASAIASASDGWKILVLRDEIANTNVNVTQNGIEIEFKRGVTRTKGTATIGLTISGNDCLIKNARMKDFSVGGDIGIKINSGALRTYLDAVRYKNCATDLTDNGTDTFENVHFTE